MIGWKYKNKFNRNIVFYIYIYNLCLFVINFECFLWGKIYVDILYYLVKIVLKVFLRVI